MTGAAIIGAGPYGLAVAAELERLAVPFRIFGIPMETWERRMPAEMLLKSEGFATNIGRADVVPTLEEYCRAHGIAYAAGGLPIARRVFAAYGRFVQSVVASHVEEQRVLGLVRDGRAFALELESGEVMRAPRVIVATGQSAHAHIPPALRGLDGVSHSSDHVAYDEFAGMVVAVVGGGQSALETAAFLASAGAFPYLVVRAPELAWNPAPPLRPAARLSRLARPHSGIGIGWRALAAERLPQVFRLLPEETRLQLAFLTLGPAGAWWLRELVEDRVPILAGHEVLAATAASRKVRLVLRSAAGEGELEVDHVVAATGYRFSLDRVEFLGDALRGAVARIGEAPRLSPSFESTVSGLHFVGFAAASMFGPSMRFVCGSAAAAELTARAVARDARSRSRRRPVRQVKDDLLVLCYHGVSATWESYLAVRPKALAAQLGYLAARGYRTVGFTELVTERPAGRVLAITFDDGYASVVEQALPILDSLGMQATVFVPTRYVEEEATADWPGMEEWGSAIHVPHLQIMGWDGVRHLAAAGWEVGSHSHTHRRLRGLDRETLEAELRTSKAMCEKRVQVACRAIAYPYGSPGVDLDRAAAVAAARVGYEAGATVPHRLAPVERLLWPRISIGAADSLTTFKAKVSPQARRLRALPGWAAIDAPRRAVRDHVLSAASARRAEAQVRNGVLVVENTKRPEAASRAESEELRD